MSIEDAVSTTIQTYEHIAKDFYKTHSDIIEIKRNADYYIERLKGKTILDVGAGPGRDSKYFSEKGLDVTGIDMTLNFVKMASTYAPLAKFVQMDMRNLAFKSQSFDGLWVCASFLHIPKDEAIDTLQGFCSVLKYGGSLYLSVKIGLGEKFVESEEYKGNKRFFAFYQQEEIRDIVKSCNFDIRNFITEQKKDFWADIFAVKK